ncbi:hypothetical protein BDV11DRAFT_37009 [Aspergillus similis]
MRIPIYLNADFRRKGSERPHLFTSLLAMMNLCLFFFFSPSWAFGGAFLLLAFNWVRCICISGVQVGWLFVLLFVLPFGFGITSCH